MKVYHNYIEDIKNCKTEMPEEKQMLEDGIKSLKWKHEVKTQLEDLEDTARLRNRTSEIDIIKNLISKGLKLGYKHPSAQAAFEELLIRTWEYDFHRYMSTDQNTLEFVRDLSRKMSMITKNLPSSISDYQGKMQQLELVIAYFDEICEKEIEELFSQDLDELKKKINHNREQLTELRVKFPEKYSKILLWLQWIDWCL